MPPLTTRKRVVGGASRAPPPPPLTAPQQRPSSGSGSSSTTMHKSKAVDIIASVLSARVTSDSSAAATDGRLGGGQVPESSELSDATAYRSGATASSKDGVRRFAGVLRAVYVVAHTEKAQRKVRSAGGGILDSNGSLTPHKQHLNRTVGGGSTTSTAAFQEALSPAGRSLSLTRPETPRRNTVHSAVAASGSPFGGNGGADIAVVVFADSRWLAAVSELAQTTVNIDVLAKLSKVFPEHLTVTWSRNTSPHLDAHFALSLGNRLDEFLRELAPADGSYLPDSGSRSHGGDADTTLHGELRARVTLSKFEIPDVSALVADLEARGGAERIEQFSDITAARLAIEDAPGRVTLPAAEPASCPADSFAAALCSTGSLRAEAEDSAGAARKRQRECGGADSSGSHISVDLAATGLSDELAAHLSEAKLKQVASASSTLQQAEMMREAQRIEHQRQVEKLLSIYDLIHGLLGSSRTCIGGARLIEDLVVQNRYGCSREEVCGVVQRLLEIPSSGIHVKRLAEYGSVATNETESCGASEGFEEVLFVVEPHGCRAGLAAAVELGVRKA